jgi:hypothetical protein
MAHPEIKRIFDELWELHQAKDADYAGGDSLSNFRVSEQFGVPAWKGAAIRMADKWSRFVSLMQKTGPDVGDETIEDTLRDLAVYAVIVLVLRQGDSLPIGCFAYQRNPEGETWTESKKS